MSTTFDDAASAPWRVTGASVRGPSHVTAGLPNQDAILWSDGDGASRPLVLAVSDGHGDPRCFRSGLGSQLAVETAVELLGALKAPPRDGEAERGLARSVVERWRARVLGHLAANPVSADELTQSGGDTDDPLLAYGTTLLAVVVAGEYLLYAQIGDGDLLVTDERGQTRRIFAKDPELAANETRSLCDPQAQDELRVRVERLDGRLPALILASTDGYVNSFASDEDFLQVGRDFRDLIRSQGLAAVTSGLKSILAETTAAGSRDDITLGIIARAADGDAAGAAYTVPAARLRLRRAARSAGTSAGAAVLVAALALITGLAVGVFFGRLIGQRIAAAALDNAVRLDARGDLAPALSAYDRSIALDPTGERALRGKATVLLQMLTNARATAHGAYPDWNGAVRAWLIVVGLDSAKSVPASAAQRAFDLAHLSYAQAGAGELAGALVSASQAARLDARWDALAARVRRDQGAAHADLRALDAALTAARNPTDPQRRSATPPARQRGGT